jgi:lysophospholipase L1-like esterase
MTPQKSSWFERNPKKTIALIVLTATIAMDFAAAQILKVLGLYTPPYQNPRVTERQYRKAHEVFHHTLLPYVDFENARWGPLRHTIKTNSLGFKDNCNRNVPLVTDKYRILFIGDSFTEGKGYEYDRTFVGLVDEEFRGQGVDILNAAVASYSPIIYLRKVAYLIETVHLKFDHLIVFIDISDIEDEGRSYWFDENRNVQSEAKKQQEGKRNKKKFKDTLAENTILQSYLRLWFRRLRYQMSALRGEDMRHAVNLDRSLWTVDEKLYREYGEQGLGTAAEHMEELYRLLRERGIGLTIAVYPWPDQILREDLDSIQVKFWQSWANRRQITMLNFFPDFIDGREAMDVIREYFIPGDTHWNDRGHRLIARRVSLHIEDLTARTNL